MNEHSPTTEWDLKAESVPAFSKSQLLLQSIFFVVIVLLLGGLSPHFIVITILNVQELGAELSPIAMVMVPLFLVMSMLWLQILLPLLIYGCVVALMLKQQWSLVVQRWTVYFCTVMVILFYGFLWVSLYMSLINI